MTLNISKAHIISKWVLHTFILIATPSSHSRTAQSIPKAGIFLNFFGSWPGTYIRVLRGIYGESTCTWEWVEKFCAEVFLRNEKSDVHLCSMPCLALTFTCIVFVNLKHICAMFFKLKWRDILRILNSCNSQIFGKMHHNEITLHASCKYFVNFNSSSLESKLFSFSSKLILNPSS